MSTPPPVPPKKGKSALAIVGIGCLGLIVVLFLGGGIIVAKFMPQIKETMAEMEKDPDKAAAMLVLRMTPDIEIVTADDTKREVTFKVKSADKTVTMPYQDIKDGKLAARMIEILNEPKNP